MLMRRPQLHRRLRHVRPHVCLAANVQPQALPTLFFCNTFRRYLRDTQGRVVQSVVSVINVALMESMEKEAPSQRVLALFDDDVVQSLCTSFMTHASSIVRGKVTIMLVLLMRVRPLALLPMFSKKLAQGLEKVGKDSDSYVSAAAAAFASAVDEFIPPSLAALQKEVKAPRSHVASATKV